MSIEKRIEKLEAQINGDSREADLYDWNGDRVTEAKVLRWPTEQSRGVAIMPDGRKREIASTVSLLTIVLARRQQSEREPREESPPMSDETRAARQAEYKNMLFLRVNGHPGMMERMCSKYHGREPERSEV